MSLWFDISSFSNDLWFILDLWKCIKQALFCLLPTKELCHLKGEYLTEALLKFRREWKLCHRNLNLIKNQNHLNHSGRWRQLFFLPNKKFTNLFYWTFYKIRLSGPLPLFQDVGIKQIWHLDKDWHPTLKTQIDESKFTYNEIGICAVFLTKYLD